MNYLISRLIGILLFATILVSCKEEEFYQKDFIQTIQESSISEEEVLVPTENDSQISNDDSNNDDSNNDDSNNDDSNNDDSNNDDSSNDDSNNDDSNNDDSSNDDSSNDDSSAQTQIDSFIQEAQGHKLDILWVIDNSGSMKDEQEAIAHNLDVFIQNFKQRDIDFQMSFTTTEVSSPRNGSNGSDDENSSHFLNSEMLKKNERKFLRDFSRFVQVGTKGSPIEQGLEASLKHINNTKNKFFREDAILAIIYVTDEDDQSKETTQHYFSELSSSRSQDGFLKLFSIVSFKEQGGRGITPGHQRYKEVTDLAGGLIADIEGDFYNTLFQIGENISKLATEFPLSQKADPDSINVIVDGVQSSQWSYNAQNNSIEFTQTPVNGSQIEVEYKVEN